MTEARRTFAPAVLLGLAAAGLAAVAGNRDWVAPNGTVLDTYGWSPTTAQAPLAAALGLVVLACWGVVLVTRRLVRRVVAVLGLVSALGLLVTSVVGYSSTADALVAALEADGGRGVHHTGWYWAGLGAAVGCVLTTAAAVRLVPAWPEMGARYDAPGTVAEPGEETGLDLWRALDEGRDPTLTDRTPTDP